MRRVEKILQAGMAAMLLVGTLAASRPFVAHADTVNAPSLVISQFKITSSSGQFFTLYNATGAGLDMGKYQLEYFNSNDPAKATSSKLIALSGTLPPHGYYMVNDSSLLLCYQLTVNSISLGLSSTAGMVEVLANNQLAPNGPIIPVLQDYVAWSKTAVSGAQALPTNVGAFLQRTPLDSSNSPVVTAPGFGTWRSVQPDAVDPCKLVLAGTSTPAAGGPNLLLPGTEPAATIVSLNDSQSVSAANLPVDDVGLMAPVITEILPNPAGSGNDGANEFIELYNPNDSNFDLSGFSLQAGTTTLHTYIFPDGTSLPPQAFGIYYSGVTKLTLSNSGGQAKLLDPTGNAIYATGVYGTAADGQAWALANGKWYWTTKPTPGSANVIVEPLVKTSSKSSAKSQAAKNKAAKTKAAKTRSTKLKAAKSSAALAGNASGAPSTPIHTSILALIGVLALLYAAYEYRADIGNKIYQLKRYARARAAGRA